MTDQTSSLRPSNDRYRIRRELATGGMATVYLADDLVLDRLVALKVLLPRLASDPDFVDRFRREAQSAARLRHPNIVAVYDLGPFEESYCIAMEYVEGRTLEEIISQDGPLPPARAAGIAAEVLEALDAAHLQGLVHRDVKPGNIMVTPSGQVKITDFGIARAARGDRDLTQVGMIIGTAAYLSPEQAKGVGVDPRADLYALGVVLFEMVTGQLPFDGDSALAMAGHHASTPPPRLRSVRPSLPPDLDQLVDRLLAKDPDDRYQSASRLASDLRRIEGDGGAPSAPSVAAEAPNSPDSQRTVVMASEAPAGRSPDSPATEIMPDSARHDRRPPVKAPPPVAPPGRASGPTHRTSGPTGRASGPSGLLLIGGALAVVGLVAAVFFLATRIGSSPSEAPDDTTTTTAPTDQTTTPQAEPVEVPDLVGRSQADAERAIADLGLVASVEPVDVDDPSQAGQVVGQNPESGQALDPGSTVVIQVGQSTTTTTTAASTTTTETPSTTETSTSPSTSG